MSTVTNHRPSQIGRNNPQFSPLRATVETAFYTNNMTEIKTIAEAYRLAEKSGGIIVLDKKVAQAEALGLPEDANILVENGGRVTGRTAAARHLYGTSEDSSLLGIVRDVIHNNRSRQYLKTTAYVGLDEDFMVRAHLAVPEEEVGNLYSWLLNFQWASKEYNERYEKSTPLENEMDIMIYSDPQWSHPDHPNGLVYFDPAANIAIILGLQYFGELKKGTLTMAWTIAHRHDYVSCHGGQKEFVLPDKKYVSAFFGLSGTGKSTLTHAKHEDKYEIKVLHDDAFIVSLEDHSSIALEPSYFDKTQDYPLGHREQDYFVTVQNVGVALDENGHKVMVTEDIRNGNGRTVKSRYATPNRVDKFNAPVNAVFWLMKDDSLPPVLRIERADLATIFGLTLTTKRSTAENVVKGTNLDALVIEPFANPFRVYPLREDCDCFETLFKDDVACYILNTGFFMEKKVTAKTTLSIIETLVEGKEHFKPFGPLDGLSYMEIDGYEVDFDNPLYCSLIHERLKFRKKWMEEFNENNELKLKEEYITSLQKLAAKLE